MQIDVTTELLNSFIEGKLTKSTFIRVNKLIIETSNSEAFLKFYMNRTHIATLGPINFNPGDSIIVRHLEVNIPFEIT